MTSTFDAIRLVIADAEPMWRDAAVDKLARDIAAVVPMRSPDAPQPAAPAPVVDREALAAAIWPEAFDLRGVRDADGEPMTQEAQTQARATAARVLAFLAARGDAAPTVSAEQVDGAYWATGVHVTMTDIRDVLAALGIKVEGGEQP